MSRPFLAATLGSALALLTLEGVSRWYSFFRMEPDPLFGQVILQGHTVRSRREGSGVAHFEGRGVRRKAGLGPRDGPSILCVGDSFTEAYQVSDDEVFTTLLEERLREDGLHTPVLNVGRSGYSLADYVALAEQFRQAYSPAWTVIQIHDSDCTEEAWNSSRGHYYFNRDQRTGAILVAGRLATRGSTWISSTYWWMRNQSALVGFAGTRLVELHQGLLGKARPCPPKEGSDWAARGEGQATLREELRILRDSYGGRLTVLLLGWFDPESPSTETETEAMIRQASTELGVSIACTKDGYEALAARGVAPYGFPSTAFNWGHLNAEGHEIAARMLAAEIRRLHAVGRW